MPVYLWNDPEGERYRESYFNVYPGVWRHGDWIRIKPHGGAVIYGRSDSTINRGGVRMGTAEIYSAVEGVEEVAESLVVDISKPGGESFMPLFVVLKEKAELDDDLKGRIKSSIKERTSPRHVPNEIFAVPDIPKTLNGKKLEVPVKRSSPGPAGRGCQPRLPQQPRLARPLRRALAADLRRLAAPDSTI
jgi:acetoacetyl-CoA synthetase